MPSEEDIEKAYRAVEKEARPSLPTVLGVCYALVEGDAYNPDELEHPRLGSPADWTDDDILAGVEEPWWDWFRDEVCDRDEVERVLRHKRLPFDGEEEDDCPYCAKPAFWSVEEERWLHEASGSECPGGDPDETPHPASTGALDAVNRHRRAVGQLPLDPAAAGWSPQDVELEAQRIAKLNPELVSLKRKLMR